MRSWLGRLGLVLGIAGCYAPKLGDCDVRCGPAGLCPSITTCGADGWCHIEPIRTVCLPGGGVQTPDALAAPDAAHGPDAQAHADAPADGPSSAPPDAPVTLPDAPVAPPDAPVAPPDAPPGAPDAPRPRPDAPAPDAPRPPPDAPPACVPETTVLDSRAPTGLVTSLSIDRADVVTITYLSNARVLWAKRRAPGGTWATEQVGPAGLFLKGQTLDAEGGVHVAYIGGDNTTLRYAYRAPAGTWVTQVIDDTRAWADGSIAVSATDLHVVAWNTNDDVLVHFNRPRSGRAWVHDTVEMQAGEHPSLLLDGGALSVSYRASGTTPGLAYATRDAAGGLWTAIRLDPRGGVGNYSSMALAPDGQLHVVYSDYADGSLLHLATPFGAAPDVVDLHPDRFSSLAIGPAGGLAVATYDTIALDLRLVTSPGPGAGWTGQALDGSGRNVGRHPSIGVDSAGALHISYRDDTDAVLRYQRVCP